MAPGPVVDGKVGCTAFHPSGKNSVGGGLPVGDHEERIAMAVSCTIYCKVLNLDSITSLLHSNFPSSISTAGDSMLVHGIDGSLRLTPRIFREWGDEFCRLLLSTCALVEGMPDADAIVIKRLASHIESCELVLGVVAKPAFDADERYHAVVFAIAKALHGIVFNGQEMLDADGATLVSAA